MLADDTYVTGSSEASKIIFVHALLPVNFHATVRLRLLELKLQEGVRVHHAFEEKLGKFVTRLGMMLRKSLLEYLS